MRMPARAPSAPGQPRRRRALERAVLGVLLRVLPEVPDVAVVVLREERDLGFGQLVALKSRSNSTIASTPSIFFVSPVTVKITRCGSGPRPRLERPSKTYCVPGTSGCQRLSTSVGAEKLPFGSKSFSVAVRLSGSTCAAASFAASPPQAPSVRAASSQPSDRCWTSRRAS